MKMPSDCLKVYFGMSEFCRVYLAGFVELLFFDTENADYWCFYGAKVVRNVSKLVPDDAKLVQKRAKIVQSVANRHHFEQFLVLNQYCPINLRLF